MHQSFAARAVGAAILVLAACAAGSCAPGGLFGKQYEYEEDLTIALDGSATLTVNASIAALVALRGLPLDPTTRGLDRNRLRALYDSPVAEVTRVGRGWRRGGRQFVQIRIRVPDVRKLPEAAPFAWSQYELSAAEGVHVFKQYVGASAFRPGTLPQVGWDGSEVVAFRLHLPSRILWHNARTLETNEPAEVGRGNIVAWEQQLADRLDGAPLAIEVRMESASILYRTLWLFGGAFVAAVLALAAIVWWTMRRGAKEEGPGPPRGAERGRGLAEALRAKAEACSQG
jgi:hypothetical protein